MFQDEENSNQTTFSPFRWEKPVKASLCFSKKVHLYLVVVRGAMVVENVRSVKTVRKEEAAEEAGGAVTLGAGMTFIR